MISSKRGNSPYKGPDIGRNIIYSRNPKQFFVTRGMRVMANVGQDKAEGRGRGSSWKVLEAMVKNLSWVIFLKAMGGC